MQIQSNYKIIDGFSGYVSKPYKYTMSYLNGDQTYTEKFAVLKIEKEHIKSTTDTIDAIINSVCAAITAGGSAVAGPLGIALGGLASVAFQWLKGRIFNADGSITLYLAYHYIGTESGLAFDPTFWPGGMEPIVWKGIVDSVLIALEVSKPNKPDLKPQSIQFQIQSAITIQGNFTETNKEATVDKLKSYFLSNASMFSSAATEINLTKEQLYKFGIPILQEPDNFIQFIKEEKEKMMIGAMGTEISTYSLGCAACKGAAYATAGALILMGTAGIALLTTESAVVLGLMNALGLASATQALAIIQGVSAFLGYGVGTLASEICSAVGFC